MHTGEQYHELILASQRARRARARFQKLALELLPAGADVLDFGAGTGIDAKAYAARGHKTFVYEPSTSMLAYLDRHCRREIANGSVVVVPSPAARKVKAITANFAVLNHFADHATVFEE
ncbi:MAG: class I SAM-dependent methyltransferase, partial [Rhodanobacteraceae bacterium]